MDIEFREEEFIKLLVGLMGVPGPSLNEEPRRQFIGAWFDKAGLTYEIDAAGNLLVRLGAGEPDETILFDAHIDVVEKGFCEKPVVDDSCVRGLGSGDNLVAVAMLMFLARILKRQSLPRPLLLVFSVGEEGIGNLKGTRQLVDDLVVPPRVFVSFDLCCDSYSLDGVGSNRYQADVKCSGGHSWNDYGKPNAIELLTDYFAQLKTQYRNIISKKPDMASYNIGHINGGSGVNCIARHALAQFEFRSIDPELLQKLDSLAWNMALEYGKLHDVVMNLQNIGQRPAARSIGADWIEPLIRNIWAEEGLSPISIPRSTNINVTLAAGWPSICVGLCRSYGHHSEDEFVERNSLAVGWRLLLRLAKRLA